MSVSGSSCRREDPLVRMHEALVDLEAIDSGYPGVVLPPKVAEAWQRLINEINDCDCAPAEASWKIRNV